MLFLQNLDTFKEELIMINSTLKFTSPKTIFSRKLENYSFLRTFLFINKCIIDKFDFFQLKRIKELNNLSLKALKNFPSYFFLPNLIRLDLGCNYLTNFPENLKFSQLRELYLDNNLLTSFPENLKFPNLEILHLSFNHLSSFVCKFPKLIELYLDNNHLTDFVTSLFPNLILFSCLNNLLTDETINKIKKIYKLK